MTPIESWLHITTRKPGVATILDAHVVCIVVQDRQEARLTFPLFLVISANAFVAARPK